jgi:hypothetical protein
MPSRRRSTITCAFGCDVLEIEINNAEELSKTLGSMIEQIKLLGSEGLPNELTAWQVEDMRRRYPHTETPDDKTATTEIYPRSRLSDDRRRQRRQPRVRILAKPRGAGRQSAHSNRPILRPELLTKLVERMDALMQTALKWKPGGR